MTSSRKSKVDIVYEYLLSEMAQLHYQAGDRLIISQIAKECSVSEIPVREALRRLESDGYVRINVNQGAVAVGIDKNSINNIFQIKGVLEGYATRLGIDYLSVNDIRNLRAINREMWEAANKKEYSLYSQLNIKFHLYIYEKLPHKELTSLIMDLWKKWSITKTVFSVVPSRMELSYNEHEHIIQLIEGHRYAEVEEYVRQHKFHAAEQMISQLHD